VVLYASLVVDAHFLQKEGVDFGVLQITIVKTLKYNLKAMRGFSLPWPLPH
jgi:hypothetical protein